jgi:hypothetical protein
LVAGGVGPLHDLLEPFEVLKKPGVEFEFEVAGGASRAVVRLADLPVGSDVESKHENGSLWALDG